MKTGLGSNIPTRKHWRTGNKGILIKADGICNETETMGNNSVGAKKKNHSTKKNILIVEEENQIISAKENNINTPRRKEHIIQKTLHKC